MLERRGGWQGDSLLRLTAYGSAAAEAQLLRQANWADNQVAIFFHPFHLLLSSFESISDRRSSRFQRHLWRIFFAIRSQAPGRLLLRHIRQSLAVFDLLFRADHRLRATHPPVQVRSIPHPPFFNRHDDGHRTAPTQDAGDETTAAAAAAEPLAPTALESQLLARSVQAGQPTLVSVLAHYGWCHFDPALSILALKVGGFPNWWVVTPRGVVIGKGSQNFSIRVSRKQISGNGEFPNWWVMTPTGVVTQRG